MLGLAVADLGMYKLYNYMYMYRLDADLKRIEQCHQMERWTNESDIFQDYDKMEQKKEQERVARDIKTCARERWFLLKIKAKFVGMCMFTYV